jgi:hypothetical protein
MFPSSDPVDLEKWRLSRLILWPGRPKPRDGELLSSWIARLAEANGLDFEEFCDAVFRVKASAKSWWTIDWMVSALHFDSLSLGAFVPSETIRMMSLGPCARLFKLRQGHSLGRNLWFVPNRLKRDNHGTQWCPQCVSEFPHVKRDWQLSFVTTCSKHHRLLIECCDRCRQRLIWLQRVSGPRHPSSLPSFISCVACDRPDAICDEREVARLQRTLLTYLNNVLHQSDEEATNQARAFFKGFRVAIDLISANDIAEWSASTFSHRRRRRIAFVDFEKQSVRWRFEVLSALSLEVGHNITKFYEHCVTIGMHIGCTDADRRQKAIALLDEITDSVLSSPSPPIISCNIMEDLHMMADGISLLRCLSYKRRRASKEAIVASIISRLKSRPRLETGGGGLMPVC